MIAPPSLPRNASPGRLWITRFIHRQALTADAQPLDQMAE